jgi:hypothetical protein
MTTLHLVFESQIYAVRKKSVLALLNHHRGLADATTYTVRSSVPVAIFEAFVESLNNRKTPEVTKDNAGPLSLLAQEFFDSELAAKCATFPVSVDQFGSLSARVSKLERQLASFANPPCDLTEAIESQERGLETLRLALERLKAELEEPGRLIVGFPKERGRKPAAKGRPVGGSDSDSCAPRGRSRPRTSDYSSSGDDWEGRKEQPPLKKSAAIAQKAQISRDDSDSACDLLFPTKRKARSRTKRLHPSSADDASDESKGDRPSKKGAAAAQSAQISRNDSDSESGSGRRPFAKRTTPPRPKQRYSSSSETDDDDGRAPPPSKKGAAAAQNARISRDESNSDSHADPPATTKKQAAPAPDQACYSSSDDYSDESKGQPPSKKVAAHGSPSDSTNKDESPAPTSGTSVSQPPQKVRRDSYSDSYSDSDSPLPLPLGLPPQPKSQTAPAPESVPAAGRPLRQIVIALGDIVIPVPDSLWRSELPISAPTSMDGIIGHLAKKHGGNVHEKGIVTITSKSGSPKSIADATSGSTFHSRNKPGQWICWDFHKQRVSPLYYITRAFYLKSWVLEGSIDGATWTEIHRQTDNASFKGGWATVVFSVSNLVQCQFIRLTQIGTNGRGKHQLSVNCLEFFGRLHETGPMKQVNSVDGIISELTKKHGGNVHKKRIVKITTVSQESGARKNLADVTSGSTFRSRDEPRQGITWDFGRMVVRVTQYKIWARYLRSWVLYGCSDGRDWVEIDRQTDNQDFRSGWNTASFTVRCVGDFSLLRLEQTGPNHKGDVMRQTKADFTDYHFLELKSVEFVGCFWESREAARENQATALDGIISYLAKKGSRNVHEKGTVTITAKSGWNSEWARQAEACPCGWSFTSDDEPGQWVCWDFGEMRVHPTHYTLGALSLQSWVIEGSLDGRRWTEIDRQTENRVFPDLPDRVRAAPIITCFASFCVSHSAEFRFIRLTQTGKSRAYPPNSLHLVGAEFFGTLCE